MTSIKKIITNRNYGGYDTNNHLLINLSNAIKISKDFNLLYINFSSNDYFNKKEGNKIETSKSVAVLPFKPAINANSEKMSMNFRKKIETDYDNDLQNKLNTISTAKATIAGPNINYFQSLLNKKKKQEKSMAKLKEANELNELKNCSFSPKINNNIPTDKRDLRWIKLFKYGTQKLQGKKR